jgi:hypothetical protein
MRKVFAPVTVLFGDRYVPPGTEIELPEDEAQSLIERHGPGGEITLTDKDRASIETLNKFHAQNS